MKNYFQTLYKDIEVSTSYDALTLLCDSNDVESALFREMEYRLLAFLAVPALILFCSLVWLMYDWPALLGKGLKAESCIIFT